jgi:cytochrome bd-type quinol oxidase subunit 1
LFGHLNGRYVGTYQPSKIAAIEARWNDEKPASEVLMAWPNVENRRNLYAGGEFGWFSPFAILCGVGLCLGYAYSAPVN